MKKCLFLGLLLAIVGMLATGCSSCQSGNQKQDGKDSIAVVDTQVVAPAVVEDDIDGVVPDLTVSVENIIATDRQTMYQLAEGQSYKFFECDIKLTDFLNSENCDGKILSVTNVFQQVIEKGKGFDTKVWKFVTTGKGTQKFLFDDAFWIENYPLNDEPTPITFEKAFERIMKANVVKPESRNCVLRKPVGPTPCNAQYIFGNIRQQIYVDAVTGEVRTKNPAFDGFLNKPLGEWP